MPVLYLCGMKNYIAYYRVSTQRQGVSGLGLEAQQTAVHVHLRGGSLLAEYTDIESGKNNNRPELLKALQHCKNANAVLIIAKLDRLSRNMQFIAWLMESKVKFTCCDMPDANELTIHIMAAMAHHERQAISTRTKEALSALKARGVKLGKPENLTDAARAKGTEAIKRKAAERKEGSAIPAFVEMLRSTGSTLQQIADMLNSKNVKTPRGGTWTATQVSRLLPQ